MITVLAGGVGAARMLSGLVQAVPASQITAIVNVGDDLVLHGLRISPDLDTVTYTLAGAINPDTGWGLVDESWQAKAELERYGGVTWFGLGDRDLGTHLFRTQALADGDTLAEVTDRIRRAWGLEVTLLPATNGDLRTMITVAGADLDEDDHEDAELSFQEYFVKHHHDVAVRGVRFAGAEDVHPAPGTLEALRDADTIVIAPSNPIVSIGPVLAVDGIAAAVRLRRDSVVAVSPIIAGSALKGPADRLMTELGHESSVVGVARLYQPFISTLVIDEADAELAPLVEAEGVDCVVAQTIMRTPEVSAALARTVLEAGNR